MGRRQTASPPGRVHLAAGRGGTVIRRAPIVAIAWLLAAVASEAAPLELDTLQRRLSVEAPALERVGTLRFRGALEITAADPNFGGFSGLLIDPGGRRLTAVTDAGYRLTARIGYQDGRIAEIGEATLEPLGTAERRPFREKRLGDAESLAVLPDGALLVGFEQRHRIWRYPAGSDPLTGVPEALPAPPGIERAPGNEGLEALVVLADGSLLAITEGLAAADGLAAFRYRDGTWDRMTYRREAQFAPSGATLLPDGDVLVLERRFTLLGGIAIRVVRLAAASLEPGARLTGHVLAELRPPLTIDNMEGIAARRGEAGETLVYLISDDNFSPLQRTLLMMFALEE